MYGFLILDWGGLMLWNLAFHAAKLASRGINSFANSEAGQKLGEKTSEVFEFTREKVAESFEKNRSTFNSNGNPGQRLKSGQTVVLDNGKVGTVVRYLLESELGGDPKNSSESNLVLIELLQYEDELSRYIFTSANSCQVV